MSPRLCKVLVLLIINCLITWCEKELTEQQQNFRSGRGTADGIYMVKCVHQITDKIKKPSYALFIVLVVSSD